MKALLIFCASLGAILLYLITLASANTSSFSGQYTLLLGAGVGVVLLLAGLVAFQLFDLRKKLKAEKFGSKLTLRLVIFFSLMSIIPGMLIYGVSVQFLSKSIESWFDVRVDKALEGGLNLGKSTLDNMLKDLEQRANIMAFSLANSPAEKNAVSFTRLLEQSGIKNAALFSRDGQALAFSGENLIPEPPSPSILSQINVQKTYSVIESTPNHGLILRVIVLVNPLGLHEDLRFLQLLQKVPNQIAADAEIVQSAYRDYQELSFSRLGLKKLYGLTLTLSLLLALLCALALAFILSEKLSAPLGILAEGTRAVAQGDFSQYHPVQSRDELGILTQSFNLMTHQLFEAKVSAQNNQAQLESAKAYLESILANLSSGVLVFDELLMLRSVNPAASQILDAELSQLAETSLSHWEEQLPYLAPFTKIIQEAIESPDGQEWQRQVHFSGKSGEQVLLARGSQLPAVSERGYIVVFDDITHLLQAQRNAAWGEVAKRLAHEIKNPLTPIQLSAERLQHKLVNRLDSADAEVLNRSTQTIVNQVSALKNMVDAFSKYAKSSEPNLQKLDINALIMEVLTLYESPSIKIRLNLDQDLPPINGDQTQLRQVMHNLLKNAQDSLSETDNPQIIVTTEPAGKYVRLRISDNGCGFPESIISRAFEPYITTKSKGTGLGLAIVKKIVEEHHGKIQLENIQPSGACISIMVPAVKEA